MSKIVGVVGVGTNVSYKPRWQSPHLPSTTILANGPLKPGDSGWVQIGEYDPEEDKRMAQESGVVKPPYTIPTMEEIRAIPWNGFNVVSTFSGGGGSCLGYRMAGFRVLWANEFVEAAQDTYKANHPNSILDTRDIRTIKPEEILAATGLKVGELDIFDGSPPCSAFSTAGKREKGWGKTKNYSDGKEQVVDDLFFEYVRILKGLQPKVFIAENVSGLVKGAAKGYFLMILKALKDCGYSVEAKLLNAEWLGVPQTRLRVIFVGVRNDLVDERGVSPVHPQPFPYRYSLREAIADLEWYRAGGYFDRWKSADEPYGTVPADGHRLLYSAYMSANGYVMDKAGDKRKLMIPEVKRLCSFPDDFILTGNEAQQWERCGRSVPPLMAREIGLSVLNGILRKL